MKTKLTLGVLSALAITAAHGKGLYYVPNDAVESVPLAWSVGITATYDDNTNPGPAATDGEESFSLSPFVGLSFISVTPQTTWNVYARLGLIYYVDKPNSGGTDDVYGNARVGVDMTHNFNERLRFTTSNFLAYELEPDYSQGFATNRQAGEYLYWQTDNSIGYRWSERFATVSGFQLTGLSYQNSVPNSDRFTWTIYNQLRYQLTPQTVLTGGVRVAETYANGIAPDSSDQYLLVGAEHLFSPNTIGIINVGAQFRQVDGINGDDTVNPYVDASLRCQVNSQFTVQTFVRYSSEVYDTVFGTTQYDDRQTLRLGVSANYQVSQKLALFGGVDLVNADFNSGRNLTTGVSVGDESEFLVNTYIGASLKFTEILTGSLTYNYTNSDSDLPGRSYDRNRVSLGLTAEF